jgi:hypothetical protein
LVLLTTLATEAAVALGRVPHPYRQDANAAQLRPFLIDTVDVLRQKPLATCPIPSSR